MSVPALRRAGLPATYIEAKNAVAKCVRVDECQRWADKAAALRAYAVQMKDHKLEKDATRIRDRALRRGGELLQKVKKGKNRYDARRAPGSPSNRNGAAKDAGLSPAQAKQMLRVANVPEDQFEEAVERPNPASPKQLARMGTQPSPRARPEPYRNEWIDWTSAVKHLSALPACGLDVLAERNPHEVPRLTNEAHAAVENLGYWLNLLENQ